MPGRTTPLVTNEIYHIFNKGIASQPTYLGNRDYKRAFESLLFYQNAHPPIKYSRFLTLSIKDRSTLLDFLLIKHEFLVEIISYCFMPNHFHLLLKQAIDKGISTFMSNFTNSYTRYFNTRHERLGPLYSGKFKSVRITTQEQLQHVSRYIHLNPYTGYIVKTFEDLERYSYSSFPEYANTRKTNVCMKDIILSEFKNPERYKQFVYDQASYQRTLSHIRHLLLEEKE